MKEVQESDLQKLLDTLTIAGEHFVYRDEMNAKMHLAQQCRYSPLTSEVLAARDRVESLLKG